MAHSINDDLLVSKRAFYATLVCFCTVLINLLYYFAYNTTPLTIMSILPIIFWIAYDGNERERATTEGYWVWVLLLILTSVIAIVFPLL